MGSAHSPDLRGAGLADTATTGLDGDADGVGGATLAFLLRRMRRNADFPAIATHIAEIRRATSSGDRTSVGDVTNVILRDYALSTKLLKLVNSSFYAQYGGKVSTVSRAVVILGFEQVRMAALGLLLFDHLDTATQARGLRELTSQAFLSAVIGRNLARETRVADAEEAFVCAMLRNLGRYLTAFYLPEDYSEIRRIARTQSLAEDAACPAVLGLGFEELGTAVAQQWQLPPVVVRSMRSLPPGPVRASDDDEERMQQLAAMSDELCRAIIAGDNVNGGRAVAEVRRRYAKAIAVDAGAMGKILRGALADARTFAAAVAAELGHTETMRRAARFLSSGDGADDGGEAGVGTPPGADSASPPERPERHVHDALLLNGIQDVTNALLENCALNDVLTMILETIYRGLEFNRVLLCIADRERRHMVARFGLGRDIGEILGQFRFDLTAREDPVARAMRGQRDLVYPTSNLDRRSLPSWLREAVTFESFVMLPVAVNGVCIGVIYCDFTSPDKVVTADHLHYLDTLRNQAALAIKQRS